jgi:acyl dehydratase
MTAPTRPFTGLAPGVRVEQTRTVTERDVVDFAALSGDDNAVHLDEAFGQRTRFGGRIAHGALTFGFVAAAQTALVGSGAIWMDASVRFLAPVRIGDVLTTVAEVAGVEPERRVLRLRTTVRRGDGTPVLASESTVKHPRELDGADATRSG